MNTSSAIDSAINRLVESTETNVAAIVDAMFSHVGPTEDVAYIAMNVDRGEREYIALDWKDGDQRVVDYKGQGQRVSVVKGHRSLRVIGYDYSVVFGPLEAMRAWLLAELSDPSFAHWYPACYDINQQMHTLA